MTVRDYGTHSPAAQARDSILNVLFCSFPRLRVASDLVSDGRTELPVGFLGLDWPGLTGGN